MLAAFGFAAFGATAAARWGARAVDVVLLGALAATVIWAEASPAERPNELAAGLALFWPALLVRAGPAGMPLERIGWTGLATVVAMAIVVTQSRGGLLAAGLGLSILCGLTAHRPTSAAPRRDRPLSTSRRRLVGACLAFVLLGGAILGAIVSPRLPTPLAVDRWLSGRLTVWSHACRQLADLPWLGAGAVTWPARVPDLWPWPVGAAVDRPLDDAHQLGLDVALVGGLPALVALAAAALLAGRRLLQSRRHLPRPALWRLDGWSAGLGAHLAWSLGDSLAPGSLGHILLWLVVGLALGETATVTPPLTGCTSRRPNRATALGLAAGCAAGLAIGLAFQTFFDEERARRDTLVAAVLSGAVADGARLETTDGQHLRLAARVLQNDGEDGAARSLLQRAIDHDADSLTLAEAAFPADLELARHATDRWPASAVAWRWRGRADPSHRSVGWLRRSLALDPSDPHVWLETARRLDGVEPLAALDAWAEACRLGDPGAAACLAAARRAVPLGQLERAQGLRGAAAWPPLRDRPLIGLDPAADAFD